MGESISFCFNLVIENLLISTLDVPKHSIRNISELFQSRNRESSNFNLVVITVDDRVGALFQSRNRESSNFNLRGIGHHSGSVVPVSIS